LTKLAHKEVGKEVKVDDLEADKEGGLEDIRIIER